MSASPRGRNSAHWPMYGGESARSFALNGLRRRLIANRSAHLLTMSVVAISSAEAAQPLVTDDAAVLAPKTCQLEAWARSAHDSREYWAQRAWNFTGNLELTIGSGASRPDVALPATL